MIKAVGTSNATGIHTRTTREAIGAYLDGPDLQEDWEYATLVGMLINLVANTRPEIANIVSQAIRFTHMPRYTLLNE